jgi:hypothetical protein
MKLIYAIGIEEGNMASRLLVIGPLITRDFGSCLASVLKSLNENIVRFANRVHDLSSG